MTAFDATLAVVAAFGVGILLGLMMYVGGYAALTVLRAAARVLVAVLAVAWWAAKRVVR